MRRYSVTKGDRPQVKTLPATLPETITPDLDSLRMQTALREAYLSSRASLAGRDIPPSRERTTEPLPREIGQ
jgi:hypothetical protein